MSLADRLTVTLLLYQPLVPAVPVATAADVAGATVSTVQV
jgi:hypothetical protein